MFNFLSVLVLSLFFGQALGFTAGTSTYSYDSGNHYVANQTVRLEAQSYQYDVVSKFHYSNSYSYSSQKKTQSGSFLAFEVSLVATKGVARNPGNPDKLNKQLGSQQQLGEQGTIMAGSGAKRAFRDADKAAKDHGGNASDFVKKKSSTHTASDGTKFRTHFIEDTKTGQRFERKTKLKDK